MEDLATDCNSRSDGVVLNGVHFAALVLRNDLLLQARQTCREYSFQPLTATWKALARLALLAFAGSYAFTASRSVIALSPRIRRLRSLSCLCARAIITLRARPIF
jgi:hypothetical protein